MPRDGSATKQRILDAAERLVIENGFAATSVDQVIAESGSSKGAFFHHFGSKLDLARELVDRYAAAELADLEKAVAQVQAATEDPVERVIAFIRIFEDGADQLMAAQSNCLFVSILTERQLAQSGTSDRIAENILAWRTVLSGMLRDALGSRAPAPAIDTDALADHLFVTFEGAFILCRSMTDARHMGAQLGVLRQLIEQLLRM
ncbi:MAG TPA: helix-turn-helix domain-containing protein [Pseudonocardia sp.]|jgi:TetR/AcrR family transcriptional repressor of nem operon|uniref:TetR/AcrR family transcriptional regulator n=1 Tax=Pseudonocardia sp. TaxID=60912 RepID=UPI002C9BA299|nr:helix-turn-helix domain-containing protein [Pseudonocardia sp.]HTF49602.1 helix-turn-helix domain-containing protein [Pseudonocardia sp.]